MATKVFLASPQTPIETVELGVGAAIQSSYVVAVTIEMATNKINEGSSSRMVKKAEVVQCLENIIAQIEKDPAADFG